jgi:hypothetical protein
LESTDRSGHVNLKKMPLLKSQLKKGISLKKLFVVCVINENKCMIKNIIAN